MVAWLLDKSGSKVSLCTSAVLVTSATWPAGTRTLICTWAVAPGGIVSRWQLTTCPVIVQSTSGLVTARITNPVGMTSDPLALTAVLGPAFTTVTW